MTRRSTKSRWAERASALYNAGYARVYRRHDDEFERSEPCRKFAEWLQQVCATFSEPIDVLDLGCGTGRYFWALRRVRELTGIDASAAMLNEARDPYQADRVSARSVNLVEDDLFGHDFGAARFDLVYSIGVLAEHVPFDATVVALVRRWLRPGGLAVGRVAPPPLQDRVRRRLTAGGLYADERCIEELLRAGFAIETLRRFESEAHLHCWCVARTVT